MFGNGYFGPGYFGETYFGPTGERTGGTVIVDDKKKKWTEEELKGLEDYGKARLGIVDEPLEISTPSHDELVILEGQEELELNLSLDSDLVLDSQFELDSIETPDIGLIMAIMAAHDS